MKRASMVCAAVAVVVILGISMASTIVTMAQGQPPQPTTPIQHIVIIMQENHAFDNFFGTFPGLAAGYSDPLNQCQQVSLTTPSKGCVYPLNADAQQATVQKTNLSHTYTTSHAAYDGGKMDAFVSSQGKTKANDVMAYYTGASLPDYWDYASYYALDANLFSSVLSYSYTNHVFMVAGQAQQACSTSQCLPEFDLSFQTIVDELNATSVTWTYYSSNWKDSSQCQSAASGGLKGLSSYWNVLPDFPRIQQSPHMCHDIQNLNDLYNDLKAGTLPQVSWVTPNQTISDHPGVSTLPRGQEYVANIINSVSSNPSLWSSTAIFLAWDDFGGYYDSVTPHQVDAFGYGFRVPLIAISPYVTPGIYYGSPSGAQEDFSALLTTIEQNWNLPHLTSRDASIPSLFYMFNFERTPLQPLILPTGSLATYPPSSCGTCHIGATMSASALAAHWNMPALPANATLPDANAKGDPYDQLGQRERQPPRGGHLDEKKEGFPAFVRGGAATPTGPGSETWVLVSRSDFDNRRGTSAPNDDFDNATLSAGKEAFSDPTPTQIAAIQLVPGYPESGSDPDVRRGTTSRRFAISLEHETHVPCQA